MKYTVHRPPAELSEYVEHLWTVEFQHGENPNLALAFFVTCSPCIVFQHYDGRSAITARTPSSPHEICTRNHPTSFLRGPITQPFQTATAGALTAIGVELRTHAVNTLFRLDAAELRDRVVDLDTLSTDHISERLINTANQQTRIALLMQFLRARVDSARCGDWLVTQSLRQIHGSAGSAKVRDLLKELHVSERQLERRFERALGVPVKLYLRIARFRQRCD
jgi:AraC-like DNA-binding protein